MVKRLRSTGSSRSSRAFTLIELITVIIILGIISLLATVTYLAVSNDLSASIAKGYTAQVVSAEVQYASNNGVYADDPSVLTGIQKGVTVTTGDATTTGVVSIAVDTTTNRLGLATMDQSGNCILEVADAATEGAPTQSVAYVSHSPCNGTSALTPTTQNQVVDTSQTYDSILKTYSPTAWWKLSDSLASPTATDYATGAAHPGSVNGSVTFGQSGGPASPTDAAARFSNGADITTDLNPNGYSALTISAWVNLNGASPSGTETLVGDTSGSSGISLSLAGPDGLSPSVTVDTTNGPTTLTASTEITNDSWYDLTASYDGSTLTLYVDGFAEASTPLSGTVVASSGLTIGQNGNGQNYTTGDLAQVSVFNSAISPDNLSTLYESAYVPPTVETLSIISVTTPSSNTALVGWTDPNPPTGLTGYVVTASPGGLTCSTVSATSCTVSGLTSGASYTFTVQQNTTTGLGTTSAPSAPADETITAPSAPSDVTAQTSSSGANVSWSAPVDNGGSPIISYEVEYASAPFTTWSAASTNVTSTSYSVTGLSTGTSYEFRVAATNSQGQGPYQSTATSQVNAGAPNPPQSLAAVPTNAAIGVSWLAPSSNGGTAITSYVATAQPGDFSCSTTGALNCSITGLTNGTAYTIDVVAINEIGTSVPAVLTTPVTPYTVPTAPLNPAGTPGDTTVTINWSAPASNGGSPVTLYTVTSSPGGFTCTSVTTLSCTITGLTDGTSYTFTVVATNAAGAGPTSAASATVIPAAPPGAPTSVTATNINGIAYGSPGQSTISWNPPSTSGTTSITGYTVTSSPGSFTCSTTGATTCIVTGLTAGTPYTFSVTATNSAGTGPAAASSVFTPYTVPQAPINPVLGTTTATTASVSWTTPASGSSPITLYTVTSSPGGFACTSTSATSCTVTGLTAGTTYSFTVTATNAAGISTSSAVAETSTVPSAPQSPSATPANSSATVSWSAPISNGGSPITLYTVTSNPGALTCTTSTTSCVVTGLTNGTNYTFTVTATNADGTGPGATTSPPITPAAVPGAPTTVTAIPGSSQATLSWNAPSSTGGSPITGYTVTSTPGYFTCTTTGATTCIVTGLTNGTRYAFSVTAANNIGNGPASSGFDVLVPALSPAAWYTLGDAPGSTSAADSSGNNNTLTTSGTVTFNQPGPIVPTTSDTSALFSSSALSGASGLAESTTWSVGLWAKTSAASSLPAAFSLDIPGSWPNDTAILYIGENTEGGGTRVYWDNATALTTSTSVADGTWHYYILELSGTTLSLYIDGSLAASSTVAAESFTPTSFSLGATNDNGVLTQNFNGSLSEVTLFNYPLSSTQIATLYTAGGITPTALPGAPTAVVATAGSMQASVSWSAPSSTGGSPITNYTVTSSPGGFTCTASVPTCIITGLTNGTSYTFTVTATNADGTGPASAASSPITPALAVPGAPTAVTASTSVATTLTISWTAPGYVGSSPITLYTVTSSPGGFTCTSSTTTCVIADLSDSLTYTFTVTATNSYGTGPSSAPSTSYSPNPAGSPPFNVVATAGNAQATLTWSAPTTPPGEIVTGYTAISSPGGFTCTTTAAGCTVTGLTNGTSYTFTVVAHDAAGSSAPSPASNAVTPITVAGAPTSLSALSYQNTQVPLTWTAPASNGGSPITGYIIQYSSNGGSTWSSNLTTTLTSYTVTGLTNGTNYLFQVFTTNAAGNSAASNQPSATPATVPGAPTSPTSSVASETSALVSWSAPVSTGGAAITNYTVTSSPGGLTCTSSGTSCTVAGLTEGSSYTFTVTATNAAGTGVASSSTSSLLIAVAPAAPTSLSAISYQNTQVPLTWSAPSDTGGSAITNYTVQYSSNGGTSWTNITINSTTPSYTVTGLTNATSYLFQVFAINALGSGATSGQASATPSTTPGAPTGLSASGPNNTLSVTDVWSAPSSNGGAAITDYMVRTSPDNSTWTPVNTGSTALSYTWSPASTATFYIQIAAVNGSGQGPWSSSDTVAWTETGSYAIYGYVCTSGGTISGSTCTISGSYAATATANYGYTCPSGWSPPTGSSSCSRTESTTQANCINNGGSWNNNTGICTLYTSGSYVQNGADFGYTYSCPSGGSLSGTTCYTTSTYNATYEQTGTGYYYAFEG